jgi:hypothetical protein
MACLDELPPFPEETEGDPDKSLCENIFQSTKEKNADGNLPLRPEACDNECEGKNDCIIKIPYF